MSHFELRLIGLPLCKACCVQCSINNALVMQTKETLTLRSTAFGSKPIIPESLLKKVEGLVKEQILEFANLKQNKELAKTDGTKRSRIRGGRSNYLYLLQDGPCVT